MVFIATVTTHQQIDSNQQTASQQTSTQRTATHAASDHRGSDYTLVANVTKKWYLMCSFVNLVAPIQRYASLWPKYTLHNIYILPNVYVHRNLHICGTMAKDSLSVPET
jgi:hypothetical protein